MPGPVGRAVGGVFHSIFGAAPQPPQVKPPAPMPTPDDAQIQKAKLAELQRQSAMSGRQSTILSQDGSTDKLGS